MMTWKQKCEEERFFEVREWYWDADLKQYGVRCIGEELTIIEAEELLDSAEINTFTPQYDIYQEYRDNGMHLKKIAMRDEDGYHGELDL